MRPEEAAYIGEILAAHPVHKISPALELGSSSLRFRTVEKPHIAREIHTRLASLSAQLITSDMKSGEGVDISGDIYDAVVQQRLINVGARCLLCCNILEHVTDRSAFAEICDRLLSPGGLLVVSVPQSYPYHPDPIDTYYRPKLGELADLFPGYAVLHAHTVISTTYLQDAGLIGVLRAGLRSALLRGGWELTKGRAHRLLWTFRPYRQSVVVLQKPA